MAMISKRGPMINRLKMLRDCRKGKQASPANEVLIAFRVPLFDFFFWYVNKHKKQQLAHFLSARRLAHSFRLHMLLGNFYLSPPIPLSPAPTQQVDFVYKLSRSGVRKCLNFS